MRLVAQPKALQTLSASSLALSNLSGSTTFLLPWIHLGSIGLSHGLFLGSKQGTIRTPRPLFLTPLLCSLIQLLTSLEVCQLALSQIMSNAFLPIAASLWQLYSRNWVVMELTGRPSTNLSHVRSRICPSASLVRTNIP